MGLWVLLAFGILFLGSAVGHFMKLISDSSAGEGWVCVALSAFCLGAFAILQAEKNSQKRFLNWIAANREIIKSGRATYEEKAITPDTKLVQFTVVISLIVITTRIPSRYYTVGQESATFVGLVYSFITLITGWWGIPHGPIYTVQSLYKNLTHRSVITVSDLLGEK